MRQERIGSDLDDFLKQDGLLAECEAGALKRGVDIYDFATGELRYTLPNREGTVYWLAWHPKEPRLAIARDNGDIALWDLAKIDMSRQRVLAVTIPEGTEANGGNEGTKGKTGRAGISLMPRPITEW